MSHKYSLTQVSECKWIGIQHGYRNNLVGTMRTTLLNLESNVPVTLMHVNWPLLRKAWITAVSACINSKDFSKAMVALAACIRPACFNSIWSELMGHVKLMRITAGEKEDRKKMEKREKKEREEEEDRLKSMAQFVRHTIPIKHNVSNGES
jgi:nucleosome-remodeling factor subunit BPTF